MILNPQLSPEKTIPADRQRSALIVSGSYGAGHDAAAREIQIRLQQAGWNTVVLDVVDLFPFGLGQLMRWAYFKQLRFLPGSWRILLRVLGHRAMSQRRTLNLPALCGWLPANRIAAAVPTGTSVVISTHPFASQAFGVLRQNEQLLATSVTYLTDASVHPLWVHESVDIHIAVHAEAARQARLLGARDVRLIQPLTPSVSRGHGCESAELRAALGISPNSRIALISSGSEGAGDVRATALDVLSTGTAIPVVLCGRNERLRRQLDREPGVIAIGWLESLTDAIRGSDCLIQNSGGFTTLEALTLGTPLISYRCLPGHGEASAAALQVEGLAPWPSTIESLGHAIEDAVARRHQSTTPWGGRHTLLDVLAPATLSLAS